MSTEKMKRNLDKTRGTSFKQYLLSFLMVLLLGGGVYYLWEKFYGQNNKLDQYQISTVQRGDIEDLVTATGTMQPKDYVDVGAQVSGQLKKIHVEIGSLVKEGDLLAEIDPTVYLANVDARRASLRNQQASLADKESQLALAQLQMTRQANLMKEDATTTELLQSAQAALKSAKAQVDAIKAQIDQTLSTLKADEANLNYAKIYAPITGVVVSITARQGQTLNANQQAPIILRVADLSTMTVQAQVSEADVSNLRQDMDVYFTTLGSRGKRWYSKLTKVEPTPTVTNNVVLFNALFDITNEQRNLLPQMTAQVFFVAASAKDALLIPSAAINVQNSGKTNRKNGERKSSKQTDKEALASDKKSESTADNVKDMTREERRAFFQKMTPEERQKYREKRAVAVGQSLADKKSPDSRKATEAVDMKEKEQTSAQVWSGANTKRNRDAKDATVKVVTAEGNIEERKIQTGISNRVNVQVLSGLSEGEQVIVGIKPPPGAQKAQGQRNALQSPGMGPGNIGGAGQGRAR